MPFVVYGSSNLAIDDLFEGPAASGPGLHAKLLYGAVFSHSGVSIRGFYIDTENAMSTWLGQIVVDQSSAPFQLFGGELDGPAIAGVPYVMIDRGAGYFLEGTSFGAPTRRSHPRSST